MDKKLLPDTPEHQLYQQMVRLERVFSNHTEGLVPLVQIQATLEHVQASLKEIQQAHVTTTLELTHLKDELKRRDGVVHRLDDHAQALHTLKDTATSYDARILDVEKSERTTAAVQGLQNERIENALARIASAEQTNRDLAALVAAQIARIDSVEAETVRFKKTDTFSLSEGMRRVLGLLATGIGLTVVAWIIAQPANCNQARLQAPPAPPSAAP